MISAEQIGEIIAVYEKHGWHLRRILLSAALKESLGKKVSRFADRVRVVDADIDAAWFSRAPAAGGVAWEIRHLGETPYALLENIDENASEFEDRLRALEIRLCDYTARGKPA